VGGLDCLLATSQYDLLLADSPNGLGDALDGSTWGPTIDGVEFTMNPRQALLRGMVAPGVRTIIGTNRDEGTAFMGYTKTGELPGTLHYDLNEAGFMEWANTTFGPDAAPHLRAMYAPNIETLGQCSAGYIPNWWWAASRVIGDYMMDCPAQQAARLLSYFNNASYLYQLECVPRGLMAADGNWVKANIGVTHGSELRFVFHDFTELRDPAAKALASSMTSYWGNFAHSGNPNIGPDGKAIHFPWPLYDPQMRNESNWAISFTCPGAVGVRHIEEKCRYWDNYAKDAAALSREGPQDKYKTKRL